MNKQNKHGRKLRGWMEVRNELNALKRGVVRVLYSERYDELYAEAFISRAAAECAPVPIDMLLIVDTEQPMRMQEVFDKVELRVNLK